MAPGTLILELGYSLDVNALNFCRFSLLRLEVQPPSADMRALVAVPNLVESSLASPSFPLFSLFEKQALWFAMIEPFVFLIRLIYGLFRPWREYTQLSEKAVRIPQRYLDPTAEEQKTRQVRGEGVEPGCSCPSEHTHEPISVVYTF